MIALALGLGLGLGYVVARSTAAADGDLSAGLGGEVVVYSGVKPGDRVIVDGLFKARPGSEVKPVPLQEGAPRGPAPEAPKEAAKPASAKK